MMPGTGLARDASLPQRIGWNLMSPMARWVSGMSTPQCSGLTLAAMALGDHGPSGGRYVHIDHDVEPSPRAFDVDREERLWSVAHRLVGRPASGKPRDPADAVTDDVSGTRSTTPHELTG